MNATALAPNPALVENLLARACEDLCGLYRCVDEERWGGVHTHAASAIKMVLSACLAAKGRLAADDIWQAFREQYRSAFEQMAPALLQIASLRKAPDSAHCTAEGWEGTRDHVRRVLVAMVQVLPKRSIGRTRLNMAAQLLAWERRPEAAVHRASASFGSHAAASGARLH